jgi:hypothetical protein
MPSRAGKGAPSRSGRPSQGETIAEIFRLRRASGLPIDNFSAEARSISAVWAEHKPDQQAPAPGTVRAHVARLAKDHQHHPLETAQK